MACISVIPFHTQETRSGLRDKGWKMTSGQRRRRALKELSTNTSPAEKDTASAAPPPARTRSCPTDIVDKISKLSLSSSSFSSSSTTHLTPATTAPSTGQQLLVITATPDAIATFVRLLTTDEETMSPLPRTSHSRPASVAWQMRICFSHSSYPQAATARLLLPGPGQQPVRSRRR